MKIDILTLFPAMFKGPFDESIIKRAREKKLVEIKIHNLRDWAVDKRGTVDNRPYGGGVGMVMRVDIIDRALSSLKWKMENGKWKIILLTPQGKVFNQKKAQQFSKLNHLILLCGHYEGVDERVSQHLIDEEISIGDYVLTGGEIPAMVLVDALTRLIPGVLKKGEAITSESFSCSDDLNHDNKKGLLLEAPQYTRPEEFKGWKVPEILLSGNHQEIEKWRGEKALEITKKKRPDLVEKQKKTSK